MAQQTSRESLRDRVDDWFGTPLILASIALIVLLLVELTHDLGPLWEWAERAIHPYPMPGRCGHG
jgi:hypothetical protein